MLISNFNNILDLFKEEDFKNLDIEHNSKFLTNKLYLNKLCKVYENLTQSEILFLKRHQNKLENLNIFCPICGRKNNFIQPSLGYHKHCSYSCSTSDKNVKEKAIKTNIKKHNVTYYRNMEKSRRTKSIRYKNEYFTNLEKGRQTLLQTRGVDNYSKTEDFKKLFKNKTWNDEIQYKKYKTRKKNKTFNRRSKAEIRCYERVKEKFPLAEHSYFDKKRYPFNCDIYVPELDLFIECHFGFAHGGEPFDSNNERHLKEIEKCRIKKDEINKRGKKKDGYKEKIKIWTESDPLKLKTFKDNKLNYKIFYTEKEFNDWFNNF